MSNGRRDERNLRADGCAQRAHGSHPDAAGSSARPCIATTSIDNERATKTATRSRAFL
jgi:hypothetical protein